MEAAQAILERLEKSLRSAAAQTRDSVSVPGFDLFVDKGSDAYHLSFAVPTQSKTDWKTLTARMRRAFVNHSRRPRLEYIQELHPSLGKALEAAGFQLEMRAPVMVLTSGKLADPPGQTQGRYSHLSPESQEPLEAFLRGQSLAYGGTGLDDGALVWLPSMVRGLRQGTLLAAGLEQEDQWVSGASVQLGGDVGELAGVWTLPSKQGQGLAFELCQRLLSHYFELGHELCWLSAAEGAQRLYEKLGFSPVGTQLNYGLPENAS